MREQDGPDHPLTHTHGAGARIPDGSGAVVDIGRGISDGIADRHGKSVVVVDTVPGVVVCLADERLADYRGRFQGDADLRAGWDRPLRDRHAP